MHSLIGRLRDASPLIVLLFLARPTFGDLLIYDGFDYTVGERIIGQLNTAANQTWADPTAPAQPAAGVDTQLILEGSLSHAGLPESTGNSLANPANIQSNIARIDLPNRPYTIAGGAQSLFFSFIMRLSNWKELDDATAAGTTHQNGDFIAGFTASTGGMSGANVYAGQFRIRREVVDGMQTGRYQLGIHKNNLSGGVADWDVMQSYAVGENVFVVGEYQFGTTDVFDDVARLWVNPAPGAEPGDPDVESTAGYDVSTAAGAAQGNINSFWFRSGNTFQPGDVIFDELRIGTMIGDVLPAGEMPPSGDFNNDQIVDGADFLLWQQGLSPTALSATDLDAWIAAYGGPGVASAVAAAPEPGALAIAAGGAALLVLCSRRSACLPRSIATH